MQQVYQEMNVQSFGVVTVAGRKKIKYKPKEYNLDAIMINTMKYYGQINDTTVLSAKDRRRLYKAR